ncbi:hypothetical protein SMICM17S_01707 [Streptomyces microflavus]
MTTRRATATEEPVAATAPGPVGTSAVPGATAPAPSRRARIEGLLLGLASGDAAGWPAARHRAARMPEWTRRLTRELDTFAEQNATTTLPVPIALNQPPEPLRLGPSDDAEWAAFAARTVLAAADDADGLSPATGCGTRWTGPGDAAGRHRRRGRRPGPRGGGGGAPAARPDLGAPGPGSATWPPGCGRPRRPATTTRTTSTTPPAYAAGGAPAPDRAGASEPPGRRRDCANWPGSSSTN